MDIKSILDRASKLKIAVIGDLIIDSYIYGDVQRISPEAPVPVVFKKETKESLGGAGNVYLNLANLGVDVELYCNFQGEPIWPEVEKIYTNNFPHAKKTRVMCGNHHLLRIDDELEADQIEWYQYNQFSWWKRLMDEFHTYDAVVISDYGKGVISDSVVSTIMEFYTIYKAAGKEIPIIVDAKNNFSRFQGATIVKCNKSEANVRNNGLWEKLAKFTVVTQGAHGIGCFDQQSHSYHFKGIPVNIVDVCGAGDTVTAVLAMAYDGTNIGQACELANSAAAEVCRHPGVYPITKEDLYRIFHISNDGNSFAAGSVKDTIYEVMKKREELDGGDDYPVIPQ